MTVLVDPKAIPSFIERVRHRYHVEVDQPERFVRETRVLPVASAAGVRIDLLFGLMSSVARASSIACTGRTVRVCTAEDLIVMKIVSDRPRDIEDARAIVQRQHSTLDVAYLEPRIVEMATMLDEPEILERWRRWKAGED